MSRQAVDRLWLTLGRADGATTRMGVTSEHPLFVTGEGWVSTGELAPGDQIRDAAFRALTVLAVKRELAPRIVHNLEVAGAHTYFAGELEAWGHNASKRKQRQILSYIEWWKNRGRCGATGIPTLPPNYKVAAAEKGTYEHNPAQSRGGRDGFSPKNTCYCGRCNSRYGNRDEDKPPNPNNEPW